MLKFSHRTLIILSGLIWFVVGVFLVSLGLHFILDTLQVDVFSQKHFSIAALFALAIGDLQQAALILVSICLFIGYIKGRFFLAKSVKRQVARILDLPNPVSLKFIYSKWYYLLLATMIGLGFLIRYLPISLDTRGAIDLTIGAALINGALIYFRFAISYTISSAKEDSR